VLAVTTNETGVEWIAVSNAVTDASSLTNFPAFLLQTNGNAAALTNFPAELLRTNGSAAELTSFPTLNQNTTGTASNVTGIVAIANGGSGAATASNARVNLLPSYTGNELRVLALNSNATDVVWSVDGGGQANLTNVTNTLGIANGGTGGTDTTNALHVMGIVQTNSFNSTTYSSVQLGWNALAGTDIPQANVAIGRSARVASSVGPFVGAVVIGLDSTNTGGRAGGISIGRAAHSEAHSVAVGYSARAVGSVALGFNARAIGHANTSTVNENEGTNSVIAIGNNSFSTNSTRSIAIGSSATITNGTDSIQLGSGTNTNSSTIQYLSAGSVGTNEWAAISGLSTYPTTNIQVTVVGGATNTLVFTNGILMNVTTP
jgi:hypothetical protein